MTARFFVEVPISAEEVFAAQWEAENQQAFENPPFIDGSVLQSYVGRHEMLDIDSPEPVYPITLISEDVALFVELPDQVVYLYPSNDTLFVVDNETRLEFLPPESMSITVIFLKSHGTSLYSNWMDD